MDAQAATVTIGDARLRVVRWEAPSGAPFGRPTLVLLHDSLGSVRLWRDLPARLRDATGCPVLAYDRQGHGESSPYPAPPAPRRAKTYLETEAAVLEDVLASCAVGPAVLVGHSDGGTIALLAAARAGEGIGAARIAGIIIEAGHVFVEPITVQGIAAALETYRTTDLKVRLERYHGDKAESLVRLWAEGWTSPEFRSWNIEHRLPSITCPALVIQGDRDEYATLAQVESIAGTVRGPVRTLVLPGIGHTPHKEAPEAVLAAMAGFVADLPARTRDAKTPRFS